MKRPTRTKYKAVCPRCSKRVSVYEQGGRHFVAIHNPPLHRGAEEAVMAALANKNFVCPGSKTPVKVESDHAAK